jgi:transcriptional regulator with XRE-family HTH domain
MKNMETARRIREALNDCNMKPQELADASNVSKASVSQYVNGSHAPSNLSAGKMAAVLGVNPLWLMGFDAPKKLDTATVPADGQPEWYTDPETARLAQAAFDRPDLGILMDASADLPSESVLALVEIAKRMKGTND